MELERDATVDRSDLQVRPRPDGSDVRKVTAAELPRVVEAAARSFYEDPVFTWIFPDDERRLSRLEQ